MTKIGSGGGGGRKSTPPNKKEMQRDTAYAPVQIPKHIPLTGGGCKGK